MDLVSRLKLYIDYKKLQNAQVADMAGIPRPTLSQLLTGRNKKVSNEIIEKLHTAFPSLNVMWLLFGDGDMETGAHSRFSEPQNDPKLPFEEVQEPEDAAPYGHTLPHDALTPDMGQKNYGVPWMAVSPTDIAGTQSERRVQSIMVFYSDNSFEVFEPVKKPTDD